MAPMPAMAMAGPVANNMVQKVAGPPAAPTAVDPPAIRSLFPETWIWDSISDDRLVRFM